MPRGLSATNQTRVAVENVTPVIMIKLDFTSGAIYLNTSPYDIVHAGNTWLGQGDIGILSQISESADVQMSGVSLTLTGIPDTYISIALQEDYQGRPMEIYHGFFGTTHQLDEAPYLLWEGRMDTMAIELGPTMAVTVTAESVLAAWDKPSNLRYNDGTQQSRYVGDLCMQFCEQTSDKEIVWK